LTGNRGLRLTNAVFVAGGAVGDGFTFRDLKAVDFPAAWAAREEVPNAKLTKLSATGSPVAGTWSKEPVWQLIVGVAPTSANGGSAQGVTITYKIGGREHQIVGHNKIAVLATQAACQATVGQPLPATRTARPPAPAGR
jgi:hypothetical protein